MLSVHFLALHARLRPLSRRRRSGEARGRRDPWRPRPPRPGRAEAGGVGRRGQQQDGGHVPVFLQHARSDCPAAMTRKFNIFFFSSSGSDHYE